MIRDVEGAVEDNIRIKYVVASVSNKDGLEYVIPELLNINPGIMIMSTGGTFTRIEEILGKDAPEHLIQVSSFTDLPEMHGGLVKTSTQNGGPVRTTSYSIVQSNTFILHFSKLFAHIGCL